MKQQRIPWEKAPKINGGILLGHAFNKDGDGIFLYMCNSLGLAEFFDRCSGLNKPKGLRWQDSFTAAPRKRK